MKQLQLFTSLTRAALLSGFICSCSKENSQSSNSSSPRGAADLNGGTASGQENAPSAGPVMKYQLPPITNVQELLATNGEALWTRSVALSGITVQRILGDKQFILVGPDSVHTLLVQPGGLHSEIKVGQQVNISGIIDPLGKDLSQWNVSAADRQALAGHTMFIRPVSITPAK